MQVIVDKHTVTIIKNEIINEGEYNVQSCNFQFSSDYDGLPKIAIFKTDTVTKQIMLSGNTCITPEEVLQTTGIVGLGVYAYQTEGDNLTLRYSPTPAVFTVEPGSYDEGDAPTPPTPSIVEQLQEEITQNANNITSLENITSTHTSQIESIQGDITNINLEQTTQNNKISQNTSDIATLNNNLTNYSLITETGSQIVLNVNPSNYQMTAILKDKNGNTIYTSNVIDLPIESMIVNVTYDSTTKEIVFTLQNGTTLRVSVADLVSGLVSTDELNTILASYYTKTEIDTLLSAKANSNDVYTKSEADTLLSGKVETTAYTQGQATQDANIEENASKIDWLQTLVNQMPTVSGQGTDLSLQDVLNYRLMKFLPQGVSSQDGEPTPTTPVPVKSVTGENSVVLQNENLFDVNDITRGYELQPDGRTNVKSGWYVSDYIKVTPNTDYYLSGTKTSGQTNNFYDIDKNIISYVNKLTGLLTTPNDCYYVRFNGLSTQLSDISFVKGSTAPTTYVEHEEQNYSLSLGNIELNSTPDGTIKDQIKGSSDVSYNLFNKNSSSITNDRRISTSSGGSYSSNGYSISPFIEVKPNAQYNLTSGIQSYYCWYDGSNQKISGGTWNTGDYKDAPENAKYVKFDFQTANIDNVQITEGSEVKPYFPYGQVGMWYKREYIGKVVLDGSETWSINTTQDGNYRYHKENFIDAKNDIGYCTHFKIGNIADRNASGQINKFFVGSITPAPQTLQFVSDITTVANFKAFLQTQYNNNNPVTVYYEHIESVDIPITDTTLITQLNDIYNNAHSYNGTTNITTTYEDGNEQMYLDIEALKNVWEVTE